MNRVTGVYEREVAIRMVLVVNNSSLVYTTAPDPYTNRTLAFVADGRLAAAGADGALRLWQVERGTSTTLPIVGVTALAAAGRALAAGTSDGQVWLAGADGEPRQLGSHRGAVQALALAPATCAAS